MFSAAWALALTLGFQTAPAPKPPTPTQFTDDRPFARVFQNLAKDVQAFPNRDSLLILAAGSGGALAFHPLDDNVADWVTLQGPSSYSKIGKVLGSGWVHGIGAASAYGLGRWTGNARTMHVGSDLIRAQLLTGLVTQGIKYSVGRTRPNGGSHSFPSGHSSAAFATAGIVDAHFGWKVGVPAYAMSSWIAWSRVRDQAHYLSDIIWGSALGLSVSRAVIAGHHSNTWTVVPTATRTSVAFYVIRK